MVFHMLVKVLQEENENVKFLLIIIGMFAKI